MIDFWQRCPTFHLAIYASIAYLTAGKAHLQAISGLDKSGIAVQSTKKLNCYRGSIGSNSSHQSYTSNKEQNHLRADSGYRGRKSEEVMILC